MIGTKSRCSFIQYMPQKPTKFGIKTESLSSFCFQFQVYTRKIDNETEQGLSPRVVFDPLSKYLRKEYHVYLDNFYTSLRLVKDLKDANTYAYGTIRVNRRQFPDNLKNVKLNKGSSLFIRYDSLIAVYW